MKPVKERPKCRVETCEDQARGSSGLCPACQSWWRRLRYYSATDMARYIYRRKRAMSRLGIINSLSAAAKRKAG